MGADGAREPGRLRSKDLREVGARLWVALVGSLLLLGAYWSASYELPLWTAGLGVATAGGLIAGLIWAGKN